MVFEYLASEGGIALLDVNPGLVIWTTFTFLVVLFILWMFAWKPIVSALDARATKIHADIDRADNLRSDAERKLAEYEEKLNSLRSEGQDILAEAKKDAERLKEEILASARKEAEAVKERGIRDLHLAKDKALEDLHQQVVTLSIAVASKIIGKALSPEDHKRLIQDTISSIRSMN
jgi:F-type H+-transporting ATPase subunit b